MSITLTHTFVVSTVAYASHVNTNFNDIVEGLSNASNDISPFSVMLPSSTSGTNDNTSLYRFEEKTASISLRVNSAAGTALTAHTMSYQRINDFVRIRIDTLNYDSANGDESGVYLTSFPYSFATDAGGATTIRWLASKQTNDDRECLICGYCGDDYAEIRSSYAPDSALTVSTGAAIGAVTPFDLVYKTNDS